MGGFVHLHVHTEYSLLDGQCRISELVSRAKDAGMEALAITDHGTMYGAIDFYKECRQAGLKPIIGCEVYVAQRTRFDKDPHKDDDPYHLVLLAENNEGYRNLMRLVSHAHLEGFYYRPRVDLELLRKYAKNLIALSACLAGEIPRLILNGNTSKAQAKALEYESIFGKGNFYLELQDNEVDGQSIVNQALLEISRNTRIQVVATNDTHYIYREDARAHDVLLCIQTNKGIDDPARMKFSGNEFYLKPPHEMAQVFSNCPEALENSVRIAERCNVEISFGQFVLPRYPIPEGFTPDSYLRHLCTERIRNRYPSPDKRVLDRLSYELDMISRMGYPGYFLIVADFIDFARHLRIPVGPGRGSAAASIVAYILGITDVEPLGQNLVFERFLNPERITLPDFDIDICFERREEVIKYVVDKYGVDSVAQIVTFGTMAARAAVRDVGRALQMPYGEVDRIAKMIPYQLHMTLDKALELSPDLRTLMEENEQVGELIDLARRLEGMPRHASVHAAGVVITKDPLSEYVPLQRSQDGVVVTQYPMEVLEELGLLKIDFLGLRTLTVIDRACESIREQRDSSFALSSIPMDDQDTFKMLGQGYSLGVFQLESGWVQAVLRELKPSRFEDMVASVALVRPGPMEYIPQFVEAKNGKPSYLHPRLEPILRDTYGIMIYQEQIIQIAVELAGFTAGQGDVLRRAVGKKKKDLLDQQREAFTKGCVAHGLDAHTANDIYDLIMKFANYGFNRAHAAAYGLLAYQTAYLKTHYPREFMAALLTSIMGSNERVALYVEECRRMGIEVLPPDINRSRAEFAIEGNGIRMGLAAVKNVGRAAIDHVLAVRKEKGEFGYLREFCERVDSRLLSKRAIESLIKCGAFDSLGAKRSQLVAALDRTVNAAGAVQRLRSNGQMSLFDSAGTSGLHEAPHDRLPDLDEYPEQIRLAMEKELIGLYTSGHPLARYKQRLEKMGATPLGLLGDMEDGRSVVVAGLVSAQKRIPTRSGELMLFATIEDLTGLSEVILFPKTYRKFGSILQDQAAILIKGRLSVQEEEVKVIAEDIAPLTSESRVHVRIPNKDGLENLKAMILRHRGQVPVYVHFTDSSRIVAADAKYWVTLGEGFIAEATRTFGEDSVWIEED